MANFKKILIEIGAWLITMFYVWFIVLPQFALPLWGEAICLVGVSIVLGLIFVRGKQIGSWLRKIAVFFAPALVVLAILASVFWPFTVPFAFAELLLLFYPLFARIEKRFKPLIIFWFGLVGFLALIFMITIWNKSLFLFFSSSWSTPWGVFTGIFLHGSQGHLASNLLGLCFFFYLYVTLAHTFSPELLIAKTRFIIVAPFVVAVLANILSLSQAGTSAGASGFVFALAGILFAEAGKNLVSVRRGLGLSVDKKNQRVFLAANLLILTYFVVNLFFFNTVFNVSNTVNYFAHEWAFGLGIITPFIFTLQQRVKTNKSLHQQTHSKGFNFQMRDREGSNLV